MEKRPPLEKLESRENELVEWLLENSFFHPDYDSKRRRSNRSIRRQQSEPAKATFSGVSDGKGGGKSVMMNVTLNITNNGVKNPDELTEQVVRKINDRLNDSLALVS